MSDSTRVFEPIQDCQASQTQNHRHSAEVNRKPAQAPERYRNFNPLGVQKDAGFSRFTPMPTDMAFDKISLAAKGLFFQLNTLPADWNYTAKGMATICGCGSDKISSLMKELEAAHRVIRLRYRNEKGQLAAMVPMIVSEPDRLSEAIERARQLGFEVDAKIARANRRNGVENLDQPLSQTKVENSGDTRSCGKPSDRITAKPQVTPSTGFSSTGSASTGFSVPILDCINTKNSTTTPIESDSQLGQNGTAIAEPVVSSPTAPCSGFDFDSKKKNEETTLDLDSVDAAFYELEARSLRRTKSPEVKEAARLSYRRLVAEGHSIEDISAAYDRYLLWVETDNVKLPRGIASWLENKEFGFAKNDDLVKKEKASERKMPTSGDGDYRKKCQEVNKIDDDAEYRVEFAEQSDDEHLRHLAALVRAEKPVTLSNGLVDDRLNKRPSYVILWSRTNKKEHRRDYVLWTYEKLKTEGKVR